MGPPKRSVLDEDEVVDNSAAGDSGRAPGAAPAVAPAALIPPQMRRPNVSTEDVGCVEEGCDCLGASDTLSVEGALFSPFCVLLSQC